MYLVWTIYMGFIIGRHCSKCFANIFSFNPAAAVGGRTISLAQAQADLWQNPWASLPSSVLGNPRCLGASFQILAPGGFQMNLVSH